MEGTARLEKEEEALHGGADLPCSPWRISARAEKNCYVLAVTPNPKHPCAAQDGGQEPGVKQ